MESMEWNSEDAAFEATETTLAQQRRSPRPEKIAVAVMFALVVIFLAFIWWGSRGGRTPTRVLSIYLRGSGVSELEIRDRVVLGTVQIGEVVEKGVWQGKPIVKLWIDRRYAGQLDVNSQFEVDSLNQWMPGNHGVRIRATEVSGQHPFLADDSVITARERTLPSGIPENFYLVVGVSCVALAVVIAVARILRSLLLLLIGVLTLIAVIIFLARAVNLPKVDSLSANISKNESTVYDRT